MRATRRVSARDRIAKNMYTASPAGYKLPSSPCVVSPGLVGLPGRASSVPACGCMYLPITQVALELTDLSWDPTLGVWVFDNCEVL